MLMKTKHKYKKSPLLPLRTGVVFKAPALGRYELNLGPPLGEPAGRGEHAFEIGKADSPEFLAVFRLDPPMANRIERHLVAIGVAPINRCVFGYSYDLETALEQEEMLRSADRFGTLRGFPLEFRGNRRRAPGLQCQSRDHLLNSHRATLSSCRDPLPESYLAPEDFQCPLGQRYSVIS